MEIKATLIDFKRTEKWNIFTLFNADGMFKFFVPSGSLNCPVPNIGSDVLLNVVPSVYREQLILRLVDIKPYIKKEN